MRIALLKSKTDKVNITTQQNCVIKYARTHGISLDTTEIENSDHSQVLEERKEFKGFLRSLNESDSVLIYDLWVFSDDIGELTKILECLLKRSITVHICHSSVSINEQTSSLEVLTVLAKYREKNLSTNKEIFQGRPKGRMSKSKFDVYRTQIVEYLEKNDSVSKIARTLGVSRTSLKDYINSRGLKDLVEAKKVLLPVVKKVQTKKTILTNEECALIKG
ncbi:recombinase family protein [Sulfurospirillum arcachonense]|uniref:recombinase family protein n=1 Tax=Sulfurospirillum arcachonense TaxID=57666 RepID=UPI0004685523|nr:recombinase family protein [Sulfurospirillum arcachonense]